ncbi:hypothetical protein JYT76_03610 [Olleya sp. AH-315-F22]|nr:hypothetical protein [Olleya sp. AH-315-F22]
MALENCPECHQQISSKATSCPHCGYAPKKKKSSSGCGLIVIILIVLVVLASIFNDDSNTTYIPTDNHAIRFAQSKVKPLLKSPSTAKFPDFRERQDHVTGCCGEFTVKSWVDSENSFGATIRTYYECDVIYEGETVRLSNFKFID